MLDQVNRRHSFLPTAPCASKRGTFAPSRNPAESLTQHEDPLKEHHPTIPNPFTIGFSIVFSRRSYGVITVFTCFPAKLPERSSQLRMRLSSQLLLLFIAVSIRLFGQRSSVSRAYIALTSG